MYTNMEFNELIKAVDETLQKELSCPGLEKTILKTHVVHLLEIILSNNYFTFDNKLYYQTMEALMGTIPSPEECDIRLCKFWNSCPIIHHKNKVKTHARFRDNGHMTWEKAPAHDVSDFFQTANNCHNPPRFTRMALSQEITSLDTAVYKGKRLGSNVLYPKICTKPTETYQYLDRTSCHPNSVFHGFIKGSVYLKNLHKIGPR